MFSCLVLIDEDCSRKRKQGLVGGRSGAARVWGHVLQLQLQRHHLRSNAGWKSSFQGIHFVILFSIIN